MTSAMTADKATPAPIRPKRFAIDQRFIAPILITCILFVGEMKFHFLEDYRKTLLAIACSILTEILCGKLITGKIPHLASAYVTGISAGILIRSPEWWPYALAGMIATSSKYVIRVNGRHLWNPSNFAIVILLLVAPQTVATLGIQWGNDMLPIIIVWILGSVIIYNIKRFHICATYVLSFLAYSWIRALVVGHGHANWSGYLQEVAPITGPMYQLYVFFMITDPKTTLHSKRGQILVAFLIATTEAALRLWAPLHIAIHAPYYALTLMGPSSNLIEIYTQWKAKNAKKKEEAPAPLPPAPAAA
jgi:Na+-translocating ferredoxin:NAD+ oxidoreductase RnfD subunit